MLLTESEKQSAVQDVADLILASGKQATLLRSQPGERLYGSDDESFAVVDTIALELVETPPEDLAQKIDATAEVLPSSDVRAEDRLRTAAADYRVQTVSEERLFGAVTHKTLKLVRLHAGR